MEIHYNTVMSQKMLLNISVALLILAVFCAKFSTSLTSDNSCTAQRDCTKCIQKPGCVWCTNPEFEEANNDLRDYPRCNTLDVHKNSKKCKMNEFLENPQTKKKQEKNREPSNNEEIHIQPERVEAELRVGQPLTFELKYTEGDNKPLDLYYIMDLSATMKDDKDTVATQGRDLAEALKQITRDVQIGFGSFIDKPVMPFVSSSQLKDTSSDKVIPYGFKNHLNLTTDIIKFKEIVNNAKISANLDAPEGGLDAIMQAIECNQIGWRDNARKLIVMATDGPFHIAGDGKLGGIVRPNDGFCHMEKDLYTHSALLDYPSVAQLNSKVLDKQAYVIFAVSEHLPIYQQLSKRVTNSAAAELSADSKNVVALVKNEYQKISQRVRIMHTEMPFLRVSFMADCKNNKKYVDADQCENVVVGGSVKFLITVELERCPKLQELKLLNGSTVEIDFSTFDLKSKESLKAVLNVKCNCGCSNSTQSSPNPKICNNQGTLKCGQCQCFPEYQGRNCECSKANAGTLDESSCTKGNETIVCSNRGKCECSVCQCNANKYGGTYSGKFCQYDDSKCRSDSSPHEVCSQHGQCENEKCKCQEAYEGDQCQCTIDKAKCKEPGSKAKDVCNGNGDCSCTQTRKCICKQNYGGLYCQKCLVNCGGTATIKTLRCKDSKLQDCVKCHLKKNTLPHIKCDNECTKISAEGTDIDTFDVSLMESISEKDEDTKCTMKYDDKCDAEFLYSYNEEPRRYILTVKASTSLSCTEDHPIFWYVVGVIGSVLLIGILLLLLWKILTHIHDKREYSRFEDERSKAKWGARDNPLYENPTSEFPNPAYQN